MHLASFEISQKRYGLRYRYRVELIGEVLAVDMPLKVFGLWVITEGHLVN